MINKIAKLSLSFAAKVFSLIVATVQFIFMSLLTGFAFLLGLAMFIGVEIDLPYQPLFVLFVVTGVLVGARYLLVGRLNPGSDPISRMILLLSEDNDRKADQASPKHSHRKEPTLTSQSTLTSELASQPAFTSDAE